MRLYHVSKIPNLKILEPHLSTHKKPYVYATTNLEFALFFGGIESAGDFDGIYGWKDGTPFFYEAYEGALQRRFGETTCYIYEVDPTTFEKDKTSFKGEVVSEKPVNTINCEKIDNLYQYLLKLNDNGKIQLHFFEDTKEYKEMIDNHILDRISRFGIIKNKNSDIYKFCEKHFRHLLEEFVIEDNKNEHMI